MVTTDDFTAATPNGHVQMQNVIATFNPSGGECIVDLAAHLDSKHFTGDGRIKSTQLRARYKLYWKGRFFSATVGAFALSSQNVDGVKLDGLFFGGGALSGSVVLAS